VSIVVLGVNHRSASLDILERVAVAAEAMPKAIASLTARANVREAVVLSTCNRTEVYAVAERFHGAYGDIRDFFCELAGLAPDELAPHLYSEHDDAAVGHLFSVAAGLESAVVGEHEILGQVGEAWDVARVHGGSRSTLNLLMRHAVEAGKRARTDTAIGRGTVSVSHAAVEMAREQLGSLTDKRVLVIGAGEMGEGVTVALHGARTASITVINRTTARADQLAERVGASVLPFASMVDALGDADVILTCTGAGDVLLDRDAVEAARLSAAAPAQVVIVDIAMPRDVAADVGHLPGVTLLNIDNVRDWAARGIAHRAAEAEAVRVIVDDEVQRYLAESVARQAAPLVAELHELAESIRTAEVARFAGRLTSLDEAELAVVDALTRSIVAKLLHAPSVGLKATAGSPQGDRNAASVRDLFGLDTDPSADTPSSE
jgi:glutamyl-tRNA reductase